MEAEAGDTAPDSPARRVLLGQERLIGADLTLRGWEIADRRAALVLKMLVGLASLAAAAVVAFALWDASQARGLVIDAFSTPPDLAARGLTGEVAAAQVIDHLARMEAGVNSARQAETYRTSWGSDLKVEIPQTGVSIEALQRLLRRWLGHQTRVSGEIYRDGPALKLTIRTDGSPGQTVTGSDVNLDALFAGGAEALMARTSPYRYAQHLFAIGRYDEAFARLGRLAETGPPVERAWALTSSSLIADDLGQRERNLAEARRIAPDLPHVWLVTALTAQRAGQFEAALSAYREAVRRTARWGSRGDSAWWIRLPRLHPFEMSGDYAQALINWTEAAAFADDFDLSQSSLLRRARLLALLHRPGAAEALLPPGAGDVALIVQHPATSVPLALPRLTIARMRGNWAGVEAESLKLDALAAQFVARDPRRATQMAQSVLVETATPRAEAVAHLGRIAEAEALIATTPQDCYPCLLVRGVVAELAGDSPRADRWFAEAARQGPSLAFAELQWGQAKLARRDAAGALALANAAARKAPRFADPVELQGEALLAQGDARAAIQRFEAAAKLAPRWGRLHLKWGEALAKLGKADEARAKWRGAATMDLSPTDRAALKAYGV